jgi:beta-lactamase superfamily II metal-dependent hydrolase
MADLLRAIPIRYYMDNGVPHTTATYRRLMETLRASDVTYLQATERAIGLGSVRLRVLPPPAQAEEMNDQCVGLVVEYGDFRTLLTGDSQVEELNHFLGLGVPRVTVLKAAHHGSRDGVTPAWLSATRPEVVVISVGRDNPYGHPSPWALRYYATTCSSHSRIRALTALNSTCSVVDALRAGQLPSRHGPRTGRSLTCNPAGQRPRPKED